MSALTLVLALVLVLFNGAFVAVEFAAIGARRRYIDELAAQGRRSAIAGQKLQADILIALGGAQLGITVCSLLLGRLGEPAVAKLIEGPIEAVADVSDTVLHTISFAIALSVVVVVHMVIGEMVPKNLALAGPDRVLLALARPMGAYLLVARPINRALTALANGVLWLFRVEPTSEISEVATTAEMGVMVRESHQEGLIDAEERALIEGALRFSDTTAADVMAVIDDVDAVGVHDTVERVEERLFATQHTRLVVFGDGPDDVRGFVHSKDLLGLSDEQRRAILEPTMVRPMLRVAPEASLSDCLQLMRRARIHLALVTSEGVSHGVLTLDDVMRGLVGALVGNEVNQD